MLQSRLDGALVVGPVHHPELTETAVFHEEMVLVTPRDIAGWDDLPRRPGLKIVVFRAGCSYRAQLEAVLAERGVVGVRRIEFGTLEGILGCVAAGIGVTMLPRGVVDVRMAQRHRWRCTRCPSRSAGPTRCSSAGPTRSRPARWRRSWTWRARRRCRWPVPRSSRPPQDTADQRRGSGQDLPQPSVLISAR